MQHLLFTTHLLRVQRWLQTEDNLILCKSFGACSDASHFNSRVRYLPDMTSVSLALLLLPIVILSSTAVATDCDCSYHAGGCSISQPAPKGYKCKCVYKGFWTCSGVAFACSGRQPWAATIVNVHIYIQVQLVCKYAHRVYSGMWWPRWLDKKVDDENHRSTFRKLTFNIG